VSSPTSATLMTSPQIRSFMAVVGLWTLLGPVCGMLVAWLLIYLINPEGARFWLIGGPGSVLFGFIFGAMFALPAGVIFAVMTFKRRLPSMWQACTAALCADFLVVGCYLTVSASGRQMEGLGSTAIIIASASIASALICRAVYLRFVAGPHNEDRIS